MKSPLHAIATGTFDPMLEALSANLEKGEAFAAETGLDPAELANARLAPDMFTLSWQVQVACVQVDIGMTLLAGRPKPQPSVADLDFPGMRARIAQTLALVRSVPESDFEGAEDRETVLEVPGGLVFEMTGFQLLRDWCFPHFFFHVVTAYDILRHNGVPLGKMDYVRHVGAYIRPPAA